MLKPYKNLIFDLGGVLFEIDLPAFKREFKISDFMQFTHLELYKDFEKGLMSTDSFRKAIKTASEANIHNTKLTDEEIDHKWNSILISPFKDSLDVITSLKEKGYKLALLSNTNKIHYDAFIGQTRHIFDHFDHLFYSFEMKLRKPDSEIYQEVLRQTGFRASETVFFDDFLENHAGALENGIHSILVEPQKEDRFNGWIEKLLLKNTL